MMLFNRLACRVFVTAAMILSLSSLASAADQTHTMKGGISFAYPSEWNEMTQTSVATLTNQKIPGSSVSVSVVETPDEKSVDNLFDEAHWRRALSASQQKIDGLNIKKLTLAGKEAIQTEYNAEISGSKFWHRSVFIRHGSKVINVTAVTMATTDKEVAAMRKIAEGVENSLKFK